MSLTHTHNRPSGRSCGSAVTKTLCAGAWLAVMFSGGSRFHPATNAASSPVAPIAGGVGARSAVGQEFDLRIGGTEEISGEPLTVTFERVIEDSRCPTSTTCIREGDAAVRIALRGTGKETGTLTLRTLSNQGEGRFQRYLVRLVRLLPVPREPGPIPPDEYRATLAVFRDAPGR